jgi:hypothetical protein
MPFYAGIGSRDTPPIVYAIMADVAELLARKSWILRSGGADGADDAFERGCDRVRGGKQIWLPWPGFAARTTPPTLPDGRAVYSPSRGGWALAATFHPVWGKLKNSHKRLHARNVAQILGPSTDDAGWFEEPSAVVICWTKAGKGGGGTGQAIRLARNYGIQIIDLGNKAYATMNAQAIVRCAERFAEARSGIVNNPLVVNHRTIGEDAYGLKAAVYVGRGSNDTGWGNPFATKESKVEGTTPVETLDEALKGFVGHLASRRDLVARLPELAGRAVACWCAPNPCHGHILATLANSPAGNELATLAADDGQEWNRQSCENQIWGILGDWPTMTRPHVPDIPAQATLAF